MGTAKPTTILAALYKALEGMGNPQFNQTGQSGSRTYGYADLGACLELAKTHLYANGIMIMQPIDEGYVETRLIHLPSEEELVSRIRIPDGITDMQKLGSAITYLRRYLLCSMLAMVGQADDDGAGANGLPPWAGTPPPAPEDAPESSNGVPPKATFRDSVTEIVKRMQAAKREGGIKAFKKDTEAAIGVVLRDFECEDLEGALQLPRDVQIALYQRLKATAEACEEQAAKVTAAKAAAND